MKETRKTVAKITPINELLEDLDFVPENVIEAACANSVMFRDAIEYRRDCMEKKAEAKVAYEVAEAEYQLEVRKQAKANDEKVTEKHVESLTVVEPELRKLRVLFLRAEALDEYSKLIVDVFRMRRDCLEVVKDLVRNEYGIQSAVEAGSTKMLAARKKLKERFPG